MERNRGRRAYRVPAEGVVTRIPQGLQGAPKDQASRFFQLASGHAMIAPFIKEKFGWVESDSCWWCGCGRQSREHLFKECRTWKDEIRLLWKEVGEASCTGKNSGGGGVYKGRKGFCLGMGKGVSRPGNTPGKTFFGWSSCRGGCKRVEMYGSRKGEAGGSGARQQVEAVTWLSGFFFVSFLFLFLLPFLLRSFPFPSLLLFLPHFLILLFLARGGTLPLDTSFLSLLFLVCWVLP